ncbi:hypothetical protein GF367_04855 [Candidatus Woesearchaeota archaeon]|nr:hypothetical protein [Candidatus Woesearchaeota archaeon]
MTVEEQFEELQQELRGLEEQRESLLSDARKLHSLAKRAMYQTHRDLLGEAAALFKQAEPMAKGLISAYRGNPKLKFGAVTAALQEWCECYAYYVYLKQGRLLLRSDVGLETEDYLLALADLSGELVRRAVSLSIDKKVADVKRIRAFVDSLYGHFLGFDFRGGELRKKTDAIRWNLQKIEELLVRQ